MADSGQSKIKGIKYVEGLRYLVRELPQPEATSSGGIVIPGTAREDWTKYGRICAVGNGEYTQDGAYHGCRYEVGEYVFFDRYTGRTVIDGNEYRTIRQQDIVAVVDVEQLGVKWDADQMGAA